MAVPNPHAERRMRDALQQWQQQEQNRGLAPRTSSFQPHHSITIRAPDFRLLGTYPDDVAAVYSGIDPPRLTELWNPFHMIVFDDATTYHQGRQDRDETAFTSIAAVDFIACIDDLSFTNLSDRPQRTAHDFWNHLSAIQAWPGETLLRVMSYKGTRDIDGNLIRTVMLARTVFPMPNGRARVIERYCLTRRSPQHFTQWPLDGPFSLLALSAPGLGQWARDLVDVLRGESIRAIKHRMIEYEYTYDRLNPPPPYNDRTLDKYYAFRDRRAIQAEDYQVVLRPKFSPIHPAVIPEDCRRCVVCTNRFGWDSRMTPPATYMNRTFAETNIPDWTPSFDVSDLVVESPASATSWGTISMAESDQPGPTRFAVKLACPVDSPHYMCQSCLITNAMSRGPGVSCPQCKRVIFNEREQNQLRYDVFRNPNPTCPQDQYIYQDNPDQWTRQENVQRSMSDLDRNLADDAAVRNMVITTNNSAMLLDLWLDLVKLDDTYPDNIDHRSTLMPEWPTVVENTRDLFQFLNPIGVAQGEYFQVIKSAMTVYLRDCMGPRQVFYTDNLRKSLNWDIIAANKMKVWPSGMEAFFDRNLSRLLNFLRLRACNCMVDRNSEQWNEDRRRRSWRTVHRLWTQHFHGDRQFYSPKVYDKLMLSAGESWRG